ncbi:MAG: substrate-binding domain-containing protein [bacterium]|nr:substrate-binding domain-containing protein [Candidatus Colisoma equi]
MKSLRRRTRIVVLLDTRQLSAHQIIGGVLRYAANHPDWNVSLQSSHTATDDLGWDDGLPVDGLITDYTILARENAGLLNSPSLKAAVFTSQRPPDSFAKPCIRIETDDRNLAVTAARLLRGHGLSNLAFIGSRVQTRWNEARRRFFCADLKDAGFAVDIYESTASSRETERMSLARWLKALPKPCGIFASFDQRAKHVLDVCREIGLAVPQQVQVISVDNEVSICEQTVPALSSIAPDFESGGYAAATGLDRLLKARKPPRKCVKMLFPTREIVERASTTDLTAAGSRVLRAQNFIRRNACSGIEVTAVVRCVGGSRRLLEKNFRTVLGRSIKEEILDVRFAKVKDLLLHSHRPIESIGPACGFSAGNSLCNLFKRKFGMSMRDFRRASCAHARRLKK